MQRRVVELDRGRISRDESRGIYETRDPRPLPESSDTELFEETQDAADIEDDLDEGIDEETSKALASALESDRAADDAGPSEEGLPDDGEVTS